MSEFEPKFYLNMIKSLQKLYSKR